MHYACVQYKDMCGRAYDIRKRKTSGTAPNCNSGLYADYAVNLECITHVSNTKIEVRPELQYRKKKDIRELLRIQSQDSMQRTLDCFTVRT